MFSLQLILGLFAIILSGAIVAQDRFDRQYQQDFAKHRAAELLLQSKLAAESFNARLLLLSANYLNGSLSAHAEYPPTKLRRRADRDYYELAAMIVALNNAVSIAIGLINADVYADATDWLTSCHISVHFCGTDDEAARTDLFTAKDLVTEIDEQFEMCMLSIDMSNQSQQIDAAITAPPKTRPTRPANPSSRPPSKPPTRPSTPPPATEARSKNYSTDWDFFGTQCASQTTRIEDDLNNGGDI